MFSTSLRGCKNKRLKVKKIFKTIKKKRKKRVKSVHPKIQIQDVCFVLKIAAKVVICLLNFQLLQKRFLLLMKQFFVPMAIYEMFMFITLFVLEKEIVKVSIISFCNLYICDVFVLSCNVVFKILYRF